MANLIELVIKTVVEGEGAVAGLMKEIESLGVAAIKNADGMDLSSKSTEDMLQSVARLKKELGDSFAGFSGDIDATLTKLRELREELAASGKGPDSPELGRVTELEDFFKGIKDGISDTSVLERSLIELSRAQVVAGQSAELHAKAQQLVAEGLKQGITDAREFDKFLASQSGNLSGGLTRSADALTPTHVVARDLFAQVAESVNASAIGGARELTTELGKVVDAQKLVADSATATGDAVVGAMDKSVASVDELRDKLTEMIKSTGLGSRGGSDPGLVSPAQTEQLAQGFARIAEQKGITDPTDLIKETSFVLSGVNNEIKAAGISVDTLTPIGERAAAIIAELGAELEATGAKTVAVSEDFNTAKLTVAELDAEIAKLSTTLSGVGIDIPAGELRKFTVDTAKSAGVGEGVVTGVASELATSLGALGQDNLEELTGLVLGVSKAFKTDFIPTAREVAKIVDGTSTSIKDTTIAIADLGDASGTQLPVDRIEALKTAYASLNKEVESSGDIFEESAANSKAASDAMAFAGEEGAKGFNAARLSVEELDEELRNLSQTLATVGLDVPAGELRKFAVDTAKEQGVGEGVVTGVMAELAQNTQNLGQDELEELTRGVLNASKAFKTDFIETAREASQVVNGLSDDIKNTTIAIATLTEPQERASTLAAALNQNFSKTGEGAQALGEEAEKSGKGMEGLNTAMTTFSAIAGGVNPKLAEVSRLLGTFTATALKGAGIAAVAIGFFALARSAANAGSELKRTATINGFTVETMSALQIAAEQNEASLGQLSIGLRQLNRELAQAVTQGGAAQKNFVDLGITNEQLNSFYTDSESALEAVAKKIAEAGSATEKTRLAIAFFGRAGRELIPLLTEIANKGLAGLRSEAEKAGLVISNETAVAAKAFNDSLTTLNQTVQGFIFRTMAPFLAAFNQFVAEHPGTLKAIGAIVTALGALVAALTAVKLASSIGLTSTFAKLFALIAANPWTAAAVAIVAVGTALYSLTRSSVNTSGSVKELRDRTAEAAEKLAKLESEGNGATEAAKKLRDEVNELSEATKKAEERLQLLIDRYVELQNTPQVAPTVRKATRDAIVDLQRDPENDEKTPAQETEKAIALRLAELEKLRKANKDTSDEAQRFRQELDALNKQLVFQLDVEIGDLTALIEKLSLDYSLNANEIRKKKLELDALLKRREKGVRFEGLNEAGKQLKEQVENLNNEFAKSIAQTEIQASQQLLQQGGDVEEFFRNVNKQIDAVRKAAQAPIELQFLKEKATSGTGPEAEAVVAEAKAARERAANLQKQQQINEANRLAAETEVKFNQDLEAATEARAKAEESLAAARVETQQQVLELSLAQIPTLEEVVQKATAIADQQKVNLEVAIQNNEALREKAVLVIRDAEETGKITPELEKQKGEYVRITTEIEKQRAQLRLIGQSVVDTTKKFNDLNIRLDLSIDTTKAETELDALQDQLKKLETAQDLGANVPFSDFLDIAKKIDVAQQRILENRIKGLEVAKEELKFKLAEIDLLDAEQIARNKQVLDAQAAIDKLKNQAVISATAEETKKLVELEQKINEIAGSTAKNFVDRLISGLEEGKVDFQTFFRDIGKTLFSELLQEALKESLKPALRAQAEILGEKPADTLSGQLIQSTKVLLKELFGVQFAKKAPEQTAQEKAIQDQINAAKTQSDAAKTQSDAATASKEASAEIKTNAQTASVKLTDAGAILRAAGEQLLQAAQAFLGIKQQATPDASAPRNDLEKALAGINARIATLDDKKATLTKELADAMVAGDVDKVKTLDAEIQKLVAEIRVQGENKNLEFQKFGEAGTAIARSSETSSAAITNAAQFSAGELSSAARQLQQCFCSGGGSGGGPATGSTPIPVILAKPVEIAEKSIDLEVEPFEDYLKRTGKDADSFKAVTEKFGKTTDNLDDAIEKASGSGVKLAGATPAPTTSPFDVASKSIADEFDEPFFPAGVAGATASSGGVGSGFNFGNLGGFLPAGMNIFQGIGALTGGGDFLTKLQGGLGVAKGALEAFFAIQKLFSSGSTAIGGAVNAAGLGSGFIGTGLTGAQAAGSAIDIGASSGSWLDSFFGLFSGIFGGAKGGLIPESIATTPLAKAIEMSPQLKAAADGEIPIFATPGEYIMPVETVEKLGVETLDKIKAYANGGLITGYGASSLRAKTAPIGQRLGNIGPVMTPMLRANLAQVAFPTQLGEAVSGGVLRQMRGSDAVNRSVLSTDSETESAVMRSRPASGPSDSDSGDIKQSIFLVDERRPNLGPNEVEFIITDSMSRGRTVAKAVENVIKRKGR